MSVIIKGVEMPKNYKECLFSDHEGWCLIPGKWQERYHCPGDCCPLVKLPEHHGDLVDINEIRWVDHYDSDGNLSKYKIAYSDEMPDPVIKGE